MDSRLNLKNVIHEWFDYKSEDDKNRPCWIQKHLGQMTGNCKDETLWYTNGVWKVE